MIYKGASIYTPSNKLEVLKMDTNKPEEFHVEYISSPYTAKRAGDYICGIAARLAGKISGFMSEFRDNYQRDYSDRIFEEYADRQMRIRETEEQCEMYRLVKPDDPELTDTLLARIVSEPARQYSIA